MEGIATTLARVPEETLIGIDLRLDSLVDGIHVSGRATGEVSMQCRRCLATFNRAVEVEVSEAFLPEPAAGEDAYVIVDEVLDLEPMLRDALVLALPLNPLCREQCSGLCVTCGADLNVVDCGHASQQTDVRWGQLESLRRKMMEG